MPRDRRSDAPAPLPLPAPMGHSTPQLPQASRSYIPTPLPAAIVHSTPQLPQASGPGTATSVPNSAKSILLTAGPSGMSSQGSDKRPQSSHNPDALPRQKTP
ncbi:hypothetical protein PoB_002311400 [Plakobranchus ocellatus]|uniref:Uncharacterized protein n=1 Tax=Plakobranchus ocellatus TaxID=259542 RepID=A0AAV3ZRX0_9GAST|nr:hypothetical protein PoB_002311400 [Plakobranchus ocellatus]